MRFVSCLSIVCQFPGRRRERQHGAAQRAPKASREHAERRNPGAPDAELPSRRTGGYAAKRSRGQKVQRTPIAADNKTTGSINIELIFIMLALVIVELEAEPTDACVRACSRFWVLALT